MAEIEEARGGGSDQDVKLVRRQVALERRIRDRCRTLEGDRADRPPWGRESVVELADSLSDAALVEFIDVEEALHAITVAGGRVRLHSLGVATEIQDVLRRLEFAMRRLASPRVHATGAAVARVSLQNAAKRLDDHLLQPLSSELLDRSLVIVPSRTLQSLPWSVLPSCVGRPVAVSPSARLWCQAVGLQKPPVQSVVVVAGPGLPGAVTEACTIAGLYQRSTLLQGADATASRLTTALEGASMLHLAAHGRLRSDNPLFSSLILKDGPLTVYELERLSSPHHVILAGCDTGRLQVVAGEEVLGLGAAMLGGGTATLVAPVFPIRDIATVALMRAYHEGLLAGLSPAAALARVQEQQVGQGDPLATAAAASFICLGAG
jgi:hypothetical protein